jgi:hypothetical protein
MEELIKQLNGLKQQKLEIDGKIKELKKNITDSLKNLMKKGKAK